MFEKKLIDFSAWMVAILSAAVYIPAFIIFVITALILSAVTVLYLYLYNTADGYKKNKRQDGVIDVIWYIGFGVLVFLLMFVILTIGVFSGLMLMFVLVTSMIIRHCTNNAVKLPGRSLAW